MNNFAASKNNHPTGRKQRKQRVSKKYKEPRKTRAKVKKVLKQNQDLLEASAENESSYGEIYNTNGKVYKSPSTESVIYVGHYFPEKKNLHSIPFIDLTKSTGDLTVKENVDPMRLKTLYFPERNFMRKGRLCKFLKTTSLITLPVTKKIELPAKPSSFTDLIASKPHENKLSVLGLPDKFLNDSSTMTNTNILEKAELTMSDYEMINWIIENDRQVHSMDVAGACSEYNSSLDTGMSVEELVKVYDVPDICGFQ